MDRLDDELGAIPTPAAKLSPLSIVALIAAAGVAIWLLWATLSLSSRVASLEENNITVQQNQSKELVDINKRLDSVIKALANHLKSHAMNRTDSQESLSTAPKNALPALHMAPTPLLSSDLSIQPVQEPGASEDPATQSSNDAEPGPVSMVEDVPTPVSAVNTLPIESNRVEDATGQVSKMDTVSSQDNSIKGWVLNLTSESSPEAATEEIARLRNMGINAQSLRIESKGKIWYRVLVSGFATDVEANTERLSLEEKLGIHGAWIEKRDNPAPSQTSSIKGWVINLISVTSPESAAQELARLRNMGINAQSLRIETKGKIWYRILVSGFATQAEANTARLSLEEKLGIHDSWVEKRK